MLFNVICKSSSHSSYQKNNFEKILARLSGCRGLLVLGGSDTEVFRGIPTSCLSVALSKDTTAFLSSAMLAVLSCSSEIEPLQSSPSPSTGTALASITSSSTLCCPSRVDLFLIWSIFSFCGILINHGVSRI